MRATVLPALAGAVLALALGSCGGSEDKESTTSTTKVAAAPKVSLPQLQESLRRQIQSNADDARAAGKASGTAEVQRVACQKVVAGETTCQVNTLLEGFDDDRVFTNGKLAVTIKPGKKFVGEPIGSANAAAGTVRGTVTKSGAPTG